MPDTPATYVALPAITPSLEVGVFWGHVVLVDVERGSDSGEEGQYVAVQSPAEQVGTIMGSRLGGGSKPVSLK